MHLIPLEEMVVMVLKILLLGLQLIIQEAEVEHIGKLEEMVVEDKVVVEPEEVIQELQI